VAGHQLLALERKSLQPEIVGRGARFGQRLGRVDETAGDEAVPSIARPQ
jgi:hypothetical protein